jgi:hypothetical protein
MARKFIPDIKISSILSRLEDNTAIDPDINPAESLLRASIKADAIAKREALYFMSTDYSFF